MDSMEEMLAKTNPWHTGGDEVTWSDYIFMFLLVTAMPAAGWVLQILSGPYRGVYSAVDFP